MAEFTLRDVAGRVGMQPPSLYSHFASKNAIYDAMFKQAWRDFLEHTRSGLHQLPDDPRARLIAMSQDYFDYSVADLARHQLMNVATIPNFVPSSQAYAPAVECYGLLQTQLRTIGATSAEDADVYTALLAGLVSQQLANDPGGNRWRRLIPRVMSAFADDLHSRPPLSPGLDRSPVRSI